MLRLTREQRLAIKRLYDRDPLYDDEIGYVRVGGSNMLPRFRVVRRVGGREEIFDGINGKGYYAHEIDTLLAGLAPQRRRLSYRAFRRRVAPYLDGSGCVIVPYAGMLVGIERDGYTHT